MFIEVNGPDYPQVDNDREWEQWAQLYDERDDQLASLKPPSYPVRILTVREQGGLTHYLYYPKSTTTPSPESVWVSRGSRRSYGSNSR